MLKVLLFLLLFNNNFSINALFIELVEYNELSKCNETEIFNPELMKCEYCDSNKSFKPSIYKQECVCNEKSAPNYDTSKLPNNIQCLKCKPNSLYSSKLNSCIRCSNGIFKRNNIMHCKPCKDTEIMVHHYTNGTALAQTQCIPCANGMIPSSDGSACVPCPILNPIQINGTVKCMCLNKMALIGRLCVPTNLYPDLLNSKQKYYLQYRTRLKFDSDLFETELKLNTYLCKLQNRTACEFLANLCTLTLFSNYNNSPCSMWFELRASENPVAQKLPWLMYREEDTNVVLNRKKITAHYSFNSLINEINVTAVVFNLNGRMKEVKTLFASDLNLCPDLNHVKNYAFTFGVNYQYECNIEAKQLFDSKETEFFVPFLQYWSENKSLLYAIPVLIRDLAQYKNNDLDTNWLLVRRFFLFDKVSGIKKGSNEVYQYVKSIQLKIKLRNEDSSGFIYPPLLILEYDQITRNQFERNEMLKFHFSVQYEMKSNLKKSIEISVGVLSSIAVIFSAIQTWSYWKRSGKLTADTSTLLYFVLFSCGNLANVFYLVMFSISFYVFIFYKGQNVVHLLLPSEDEEMMIRNYIIVAFSLKIVDILVLIWHQITIDIFLIDWEKPKPQDSIPRPKKSKSQMIHSSSSTQQQSVISSWRSYFIANEWNEIQTKRKINNLIHLVFVLFLLKIVGIEYWGTSDPELHTNIPEHFMKVSPGFVCRFAVGSLVYVSVYIIQLMFMLGFYERFIKNAIQQFVDVCSLANISVFIMSEERFGFYIHGRSSHGFADTDMATMIRQLKDEENDLCAYRGLLPGTHHQTFSIGIPAKLRLYYNKLMLTTITTTITNARNISTVEVSPDRSFRNRNINTIETMTEAYQNLNKLFSSFIEHGIKDIDYEVRDKLFLEKLFNIEFTDCFDRGIFYIDNGHSFEQVLYYGHEFVLFTFDLMLYSFVLVLSDDFVLAILLTLIIAEILKMMRNVGGRRNLSQKTLIDERFLI